MDGGHVNQRGPSLRAAVVAGELPKWTFGFNRAWSDLTLDYELGVGWYQQVGRLTSNNRDRLALDATGEFVLRQVLRKRLRADHHEQRIDAPGRGDLDRLASLPGARDVEPGILARRQVQPTLPRTLNHHAIRAYVQIAGVGISSDDGVTGARISAAVQRPVLGKRQVCEVDLVAAPLLP